MNYIDPTGHFAITATAATVGVIALFAVVAIAAVDVISNSQTQGWSYEAFKDNVSSTWNQFTSGLTNIGNWATCTYEYATTQAKNYTNLTRTLIDSKIKSLERERTNKTNDHHIVPQSAAAAEPARKIIEDNGINRHDPDNKVEISQEWHWFTHTSAYYTGINTIIKMVNDSTTDEAKKEQRLRTTLRTIGGLFKLIDFILK